MINISDADIAHAEGILLPDGCVFDEERRVFIRELSSCDVLACPGSGKTTALLAKLLILSKKMPFPGGGGICVLTHTNVAIDEIKRRLGIEARSLISYPNFFGTIQSFIDRFLAIPKFVEAFGRRPTIIDTDRWEAALAGTCSRSSAAGWIYGTVNRSRAYGTPLDLLKKIALNLDTLEADLSTIGLKDSSKPTHKAISGCCHKVLSSGVLSYEQAYILAEKYLKDHPKLSQLIASRYRYVLIDEMQDTDSRQIGVLDSLFSEAEVITQRVGDPNQAIFSAPKEGDMEWIPREPRLNFSNSMRFGESLSSAIAPIRVDSEIALAGNLGVRSHPPYIISYDDSCMDAAVAAFGKLIQRLGLDSASATFKAVGWVGKAKNTACLPLYWPTYQPRKKVKPHFSNLISYVAAYKAQADCSHTPCLFKYYVMEGLAKLAACHLPEEVIGKVPLTARRLERLLEKEYPQDLKAVRKRVSLWLHQLASGEEIGTIHADMIGLFTSETVFAEHESVAGEKFLTSEKIDSSCDQDETCNLMCCSEHLNIEVGTVHSVKGETHTGTLLLESKYYTKHDSEYLMPLLKGGELPMKPRARLKSCVKVAHVAMSRPTHLFALACHVDRIAGHEEALKEQGWEMLSVPDLLG